MSRGVVVGGLIAIAVILNALGVFDRDKVPEKRSCAGYQLVRDLKVKGQIETFKAVDPKGRWECEYALDNEDAEVRFLETSNGVLHAEIDGYVNSRAYSAADRELRAEGLEGVP